MEIGIEVGVAEISQKAIAERANLSIKSIKRYFDTKVDLVYQVSNMILERNYREIMEQYRAKNLESLNGKQRLERLVKTHNTYILRNYKTTVFVENADLYCRYHHSELGNYWKKFRHTDSLEQGIAQTIRLGQEDGSIQRALPKGNFEYFTATLCAGFVERMVNDIDCEIKTVEEAITLSDTLIDTTLKYL